MVGTASQSSRGVKRSRRVARPAISPSRLQGIHEALAWGHNERAIRLILAEATRLARAPLPAALYRASDGSQLDVSSRGLPLGRQGLALASQGLPPVLPGHVTDLLRRAVTRGVGCAYVASGLLTGPGASLALLPVALPDDATAILVVALPGRRLTCAQRRGLRLLTGLLALALHQVPAGPVVPLEEDEALKRVVAGVAHELNNPLAIISGYAQVLLGSEVAEELRPDLERIDRAARRVAQLVRDLLAFAREQPIAATVIPVESLVADALASEQAALAASGIGLTLEIAPATPAICGDRLQLTQVLVQLIARARRPAVGHPGASRFTIRADGRERVHLSLSDDGPGIAPELIDRLFEPFVSAQEGLALAVCRSIVRAHGGRIWAANDPAGGCTFHIELPAA